MYNFAYFSFIPCCPTRRCYLRARNIRQGWLSPNNNVIVSFFIFLVYAFLHLPCRHRMWENGRVVIVVMVEENERKVEEGFVNLFSHWKDLLIEDLFLATKDRWFNDPFCKLVHLVYSFWFVIHDLVGFINKTFFVL